MNAIAFALKDWRARHDLTQPEAAVAFDVCRETISQWECGGPVRQASLPAVLATLATTLEPERIAEIKAAVAIVPPIAPADFAERLRAWRRRHRLTRRQAGEALDVHERTVCAWECCTQFTHAPMLARVLPRLDAPPVGVTSTNGWKARTAAHRDPQRRFANALRAWRKARGLNQLEAAAALGLPHDQALISNWERGKRLPKPERLMQICKFICMEVRP